MVEFQVLNPRRVAEEVYDILRQRILACDLPPGSRLDVGLIATQLGISRTPVKDALQKLSAQGLVEIHSRRGTFVSRISMDDARETFEVRAALEGKACELLAGKIPPPLTRRLRSLTTGMFVEDLTVVDHARLNNEFHQLIIERAGNQRLIKMYSELNAHMQIARIYFRSDDWRSRGAKIVEEHNNIVDALVENRAEDARKLIEDHIRSAMERLISKIESSGPPEEKLDARENRGVADSGPRRDFGADAASESLA
jgi:DNA-binding GntR family transcriptional regulator